jgi:hypothetical protein
MWGVVNRWRAVRRQRNLVLSVELDGLLVSAAKHANMSVNGFIVELIEEACNAGNYRRSADCDGVASSGGNVGSSGGGVGDGDVVGVPSQGRTVDWDAILQAGRAKKTVREPVQVEPDPLDVIA